MIQTRGMRRHSHKPNKEDNPGYLSDSENDPSQSMSSMVNSMCSTASHLRHDLRKSTHRMADIIDVINHNQSQLTINKSRPVRHRGQSYNATDNKCPINRNIKESRVKFSEEETHLHKDMKRSAHKPEESNGTYIDDSRRRDQIVNQIEQKFTDLINENKVEINSLKEKLQHSEMELEKAHTDLQNILIERNQSKKIFEDKLGVAGIELAQAKNELKEKESANRYNERKLCQAMNIFKHIKNYASSSQKVVQQITEVLHTPGPDNATEPATNSKIDEKSINSAHHIKSLIKESSFLVKAFKDIQKDRDHLRSQLEEKAKFIEEFQNTLENLGLKMNKIEQLAEKKISIELNHRKAKNHINEAENGIDKEKLRSETNEVRNKLTFRRGAKNHRMPLGLISQRINDIGNSRKHLQAADFKISTANEQISKNVGKIFTVEASSKNKLKHLKKRIICLEQKMSNVDHEQQNINNACKKLSQKSHVSTGVLFPSKCNGYSKPHHRRRNELGDKVNDFQQNPIECISSTTSKPMQEQFEQKKIIL